MRAKILCWAVGGAVLAASCTDADEERATSTSAVQGVADLREELRGVAPAPSVRAASEHLLAADPEARVTWLRGHIDAFTTGPKREPSGYARRALARLGVKATGVETPRVEVIGGETPRPPRKTVAEDQTTYYPQEGREAAKAVLGEFLRERADAFAIDLSLIEQGLPNLELSDFSNGKHFRRAVFEQRVGDLPVLDGKTIVLFDLSWNVIAISRQLATSEKLPIARAAALGEERATRAALGVLAERQQKISAGQRVLASELGIDVIRAGYVWKIDLRDDDTRGRFTAKIDAANGEVLAFSDDTARFNDAQVKRWDYTGGDMTEAFQVTTTGLYTHDDDTLMHDFFYMANDDRNNGGTGTCNATPIAGNTTPLAYGTTNSATHIRPTVRGDRNFSLWLPSAPLGSFGEGHVYFWAREYMQWQKQALVDLGVLTLGNFNNFTKSLIIVNACAGGAGMFDGSFDVSVMDNNGENVGAIILPERCRSGNSNCSSGDYADSLSGNLYTFEGEGGYHFPGVIHHELNHFVLIDYFGVMNTLDCGSSVEQKYFQEGGIGRSLPQIFWDSTFNVGYLPSTTDKLFRSDGISGRVHDPANPSSLNHLSAFTCGTDNGDPYAWGGVVAQPMWEIYHGKKVVGASLVNMGKPAQDLGMIKSVYYAADMAAASTFRDRFELANRFMEFWELFSTAVPTTKADWCEVWSHHGVGTFIAGANCS
jgi:hypothetical protein